MRPDDFIPCGLNPDALTLAPDCFAEIVQLVLHDVVDRAARGIDVIAHLFNHVVDGNPVDELLATVHGCSESALGVWTSPSRALDGPIAGPPRALEPTAPGPLCTFNAGQSRERGAAPRVANQRSDRAAAGRPSPQEQRDSGADRRSDDCRGQKVVLLL